MPNLMYSMTCIMYSMTCIIYSMTCLMYSLNLLCIQTIYGGAGGGEKGRGPCSGPDGAPLPNLLQMQVRNVKMGEGGDFLLVEPVTDKGQSAISKSLLYIRVGQFFRI